MISKGRLGDIDVLLKNLPPAVQLIFNGLKLEQMFTIYMTAFYACAACS